MIPIGPQPMGHAERVRLAEEIARCFEEHYGARLVAIGVYGSLARGSDGPYSDIEMHCIVRDAAPPRAEKRWFEWTTGPWKAEVGLYSPEEALARAGELEGEWPITHGAVDQVWAVMDHEGILARMRQAARGHSDAEFARTIHEVIVGEVYELVGKLRNARARGQAGCLSLYAVEMARWGACLQGLAHRHLYTTGARLWEEALALDGAPAGFAALVHLVEAGELADPEGVEAAMEAFWEGLGAWAEERGLGLATTLEALLAGEPA